jgi:hypothetical protein
MEPGYSVCGTSQHTNKHNKKVTAEKAQFRILFPTPVQKRTINIYKTIIFTSCFVWVWNVVSHTKIWTEIEGVCEKGAEENILGT